MKTTIEMHGYEIVIEEPKSGLLTVSAMKDGEVIDSFELEGGEDHPEHDEMEENDEMMPFAQEEEEEFETEEEEEAQEEAQEEEEEFEEEEEEEGKLESFMSFIKKRKK